MRKGERMSIEQREKISAAHKKLVKPWLGQYVRTPEARKAASERAKGNTNCKGRILSQQTRDKIRASNVGKKHKFTGRPSRKGVSTWNKGLEGYMAGEKNGRWIADRSLLKKTSRQSGSAYTFWRNQVYSRDVYKCKILNKDCKGEIEAHHILRWHDYPELRYEVNNGITLCHKHHPKKIAQEKLLSSYFQSLIAN